jgi:hypothetical protein
MAETDDEALARVAAEDYAYLTTRHRRKGARTVLAATGCPSFRSSPRIRT